MPPDAQVLTIPATFADYKPQDWSSAATPLPRSDLCLSPVRITPPQDSLGAMAYHQQRSSRTELENELWFNLPASPSRRQDQSRPSESSAYQTTNNRFSMCSTTSSTTSPPRVPTISISTDLNKPLPPSPSGSEKRRFKAASLRGLLQRESSSHLRPEPQRQVCSTLSVDTSSRQSHGYSRSMPSSPFELNQASTSPNSASIQRASSAMGNYPEQPRNSPYPVPSYPPQSQTLPMFQQTAASENYFESSAPPRARTFPDSNTASPSATTARENMSNRPRPHTWLSPTDAFTDVSQFHLFAEAMTGLPDDSDPLSPTGPPQLAGSLFARRTQNDTIPLPLQYTMAPPAPSSRRTDWQNFEPPLMSSRSVSAPTSSFPRPEPTHQWQPPAHMASINLELEMLGLEDEHPPDDELPDYAQSQAEMNAKKRVEASARARELEMRWRGARR